MRSNPSARGPSSFPASGDVPRGPHFSTQASDAIDQLGPEVAAVLREGMALEQKGALDADATARIDARLQALYEAQMQDLKALQDSAPSAGNSRPATRDPAAGEQWRPGYRAPDPEFAARMEALQQRLDENRRAVEQMQQQAIARIKALRLEFGIPDPAEKAKALPRALGMAMVVVGALGMAGFFLELGPGQAFVWAGGVGYRAAVPWLFLGALPLVGVALFCAEQAGRHLRARYPTWFVRWLFVYPVMVLLATGMLVVSPMGWSAAVGWALGTPSRMEVRVVAVGQLSPQSRVCKQEAQLEFRGAASRICLDGRLARQAPRQGETVLVSGRVSWMGLYVQRVHGH